MKGAAESVTRQRAASGESLRGRVASAAPSRQHQHGRRHDKVGGGEEGGKHDWAKTREDATTLSVGSGCRDACRAQGARVESTLKRSQIEGAS